MIVDGRDYDDTGGSSSGYENISIFNKLYQTSGVFEGNHRRGTGSNRNSNDKQWLAGEHGRKYIYYVQKCFQCGNADYVSIAN